MGIRDNLELVNKRIGEAAAASGRKREDIKLVAVTKTVGSENIREAADLGVTSIGENRVQEIISKYEDLKDCTLEWHMIGHLQRNKVKYIIDKVSLIHSVDTIALAREINKRAEKIRKRANVLLQINVSGEESKFGMEPVTVRDFLQQAEGLKNIHIRGLMTIAPFTNNPEEVRPVFARLKELFEAIKAGKSEGVDMDYLSMGMTGDYEVAIEEGANIVRVGTGIFGARG
ncbi:MAG: YggS family pyridoxal phosphate-dependent enzyme [Clostridiales bacterium]|nr:YggS family pyridoxal phosphate-dependent enzyme [Clostridiales bacterium]